MKHVVIGTAGHIDHGKTALVKALTGIDADRLAEEKRRGITIDLGFAHAALAPGVYAGFVDVPGHERFVKNMLAGTGGIDLALLVVAADESIKPQTREHFDICRLLGIKSGVVALTKADLVDPDIAGLVRLEVEELVAGSFLEGAAIIPVSSVTGAGLGELRAALANAALAAPARKGSGRFRLPIDRAFAVKGFGAVVTGTLTSGALQVEQEVELFPEKRRMRVRGIEVHGEKVSRATAGQRTAVNLVGMEAAELQRGQQLAEPGLFQVVKRIDCRLTLLPSAKALKARTPVHFHSGAAEIEAQVRLLDGAPTMKPGETRFIRVELRDPALLLPGDKFIIRMFSPVVTIGGGEVVDISGVRYRKGESAAARLNELASPDLAVRMRSMVRESEWGLSAEDIVARTGWTAAEIAAAQSDAIRKLAGGAWFSSADRFVEARARLVKAVAAHHKANPLQPGAPKADLRGREFGGAPAAVFEALLNESPELTVDGDLVRLKTHRVALKEDEEKARAAIEAAFARGGLAAPGVRDTLAQSGVEAARARTLLQILLREGKLIRIDAELVLHANAIAELLALMSARKGQTFDVPSFKEWTGISRKYAIPLLEYLDRERVTRREGDKRIVL